MALHRDIFWVGRQWAVTGYGMQAVDQKQKSKFDIEAARLWEDDLLDGLSGERWFNPEDFNQGLAIARVRYSEPPGNVKPKPKIEPAKPEVGPETKPSALSRAAEPASANAVRISPPSPRAPKAASPCAAVSPLREGIAVLPSKPHPRSEPLRVAPEVEALEPVVAKFAMHLGGGGAKFTPMWRIRIRR